MTTAADLSRLLGPLRREVMRASRSVGELPDLPDAQIEVLRALTALGEATPGAIAAELGLARSTVSNLVKVMTAAGLIDRRLSDGDGRSTTLSASATADTLLARYDVASAAVIDEAFSHLSAVDRNRLKAAIPALQRLHHGLRQRG